MKPRKLKRLFQKTALVIGLSTYAMSYAADQQLIWGSRSDYATLLSTFSLNNTGSPSKGLQLPSNATQKNTLNTLKFSKGAMDSTHTSHVRYNQYYHDLPVWGGGLIYHLSSTKNTVTGSLVNGIEKDIKDFSDKISIEQAKIIALENNAITTPIVAEKIIFIDKNNSNKATLAYRVSYVKNTSQGPAIPIYIIDANHGNILQQWNALPSGNGIGGILKLGEYHFGFWEGKYRLGSIHSNWNLDICDFANKFSDIINLKNQPMTALPFKLPISEHDEMANGLTSYKFTCWYPSYENQKDEGYAPINGGLSPINDAAYFTQITHEMWKNQYQVPELEGIHIFTHVANYDDAYACGKTCLNLVGIIGSPQIVLGNGDAIFYPLTSADMVAHELAHVLTDAYSNLIVSYEGAPINEAFADMTGITVKNYLRKQGYEWYWNGQWTIGERITKDHKPLRYMDEPTKDNYSIDKLADYFPSLEPHYASGIYNKAFYALSTTAGWSMDKAYEVFLAANLQYWDLYTLLTTGSCGVIQAASDKGYSTNDVVAAFSSVGIACPVVDRIVKS